MSKAGVADQRCRRVSPSHTHATRPVQTRRHSVKISTIQATQASRRLSKLTE